MSQLPPQQPTATTTTTADPQKTPTLKNVFAKVVQPQVFKYLLLTATILSVLSMLAFLAYLFLPDVTRVSAQAHYAFLYAIGITGLAIAEACQIGGIVILIAQWFSKQNTEKKPREIAVLLISLIPYMVILVFLVTLGVYVYLRVRARAPERQQEARQELKEQAVDALIDFGANTSSSSASSGQAVTPPRHAPVPAMKDAVRQIIGPTAEKSVSGLSNGLLVSTVVVLTVSTIAMGGVVVPQAFSHGLGRSNPLTTTTKHTSSATPTLTPLPAVPWAQVEQACGYDSTYQPVTFYHVNDLYVNVALAFTEYLGEELPANLPHKPFQIADASAHPNPSVKKTPRVNPSFGTTLDITVCDASSTAHNIQGFGVQIASFTAYSGILNTWPACDFYQQGIVYPEGCDGAEVDDEYFSTNFSPTAGVGSVAQAKFTSAGQAQNGSQLPAIPFTLQPKSNLTNNMTLTAPSVVGSYEFAYSIKVDGLNTPFIIDPETLLLDPAAHKWTGAACQASGMAAQIPSDGASYICPA